MHQTRRWRRSHQLCGRCVTLAPGVAEWRARSCAARVGAGRSDAQRAGQAPLRARDGRAASVAGRARPRPSRPHVAARRGPQESGRDERGEDRFTRALIESPQALRLPGREAEPRHLFVLRPTSHEDGIELLIGGHGVTSRHSRACSVSRHERSVQLCLRIEHAHVLCRVSLLNRAHWAPSSDDDGARAIAEALRAATNTSFKNTTAP